MSTPLATEAAPSGGAARRQFGDPAAWRALLSSASPAAFAQAWLTILCGQVDFAFGHAAGRERVVLAGFVALGEPDSQRYARVAKFGDGDVSFVLAKAAERSLQLRRAIVQSGDAPGTPCQLAVPITFGEALHGLAELELIADAAPQLDSVMRFVQWGLGWYGKLAQNRDTTPDTDNAAAFIAHVVGILGPTGSSQAAAEALCTELADRFAALRVTLGAGHARHMNLLGTSRGGLNTSGTDFAGAIAAAMAEAVTAGTAILHPAPEDQSAVWARISACAGRIISTGRRRCRSP